MLFRDKPAAESPDDVDLECDRILPHVTVVQIAGESCQLKDKRRTGIMALSRGSRDLLGYGPSLHTQPDFAIKDRLPVTPAENGSVVVYNNHRH